MTTLSMGFLKPANGDTGDVFFPAMASNIQQLNDHTHDGVTSKLLSSASQSLLAANWAAAPVGGGIYRQLMTMPAGYSLDTCQVWFRLSTGETVYPSVERQSSSTAYVYVNDNSLTLTAFYR